MRHALACLVACFVQRLHLPAGGDGAGLEQADRGVADRDQIDAHASDGDVEEEHADAGQRDGEPERLGGDGHLDAVAPPEVGARIAGDGGEYAAAGDLGDLHEQCGVVGQCAELVGEGSADGGLHVSLELPALAVGRGVADVHEVCSGGVGLEACLVDARCGLYELEVFGAAVGACDAADHGGEVEPIAVRGECFEGDAGDVALVLGEDADLGVAAGAHDPSDVLLPEGLELRPLRPHGGPSRADVGGEDEGSAHAVLPVCGDGVVFDASECDDGQPSLAVGGDDVAGDRRDRGDADHRLGDDGLHDGLERVALPDERASDGLGLLEEDLGDGRDVGVGDGVEVAAGLVGHVAEGVEIASGVRVDADGRDRDVVLLELGDEVSRERGVAVADDDDELLPGVDVGEAGQGELEGGVEAGHVAEDELVDRLPDGDLVV